MALDLSPQSAPGGTVCSMRPVFHATQEGHWGLESVSRLLSVADVKGNLSGAALG